jgi:hypothetical protein
MKSLRDRLPRFGSSSVPLALLVLCAIVYLPNINRLGFYWDDWPSIWFLKQWGAEGFRQGFASDRPLLAWIFNLTTPVFGSSATAWQYFSIFTRWITSLAWWWGLSGLFPRFPKQAFWGALLFSVYPGFSQQYIAVTYSNAYLVYFLFVVSIGAMVWAQRSKRWFYPLTGLSLIASLFCMLTTEYFVTLELIRPFLLWFVCEGQNLSAKERIKWVMIRWAPYLAVLVPYLAWRALNPASPRAQITFFQSLLGTPGTTILTLMGTMARDFWEVNLQAWVHGLDPAYLKDFDPKVIVMLIASVIGAIILTFIYLQLFLPAKHDNEAVQVITPIPLAGKYVFLGVVAFLISGWVIWITDLHFELLFPFDRFTLVTMLGTSLFVGGLIGLADRKPWVGTLLMALLVGLSTALQFQYRLEYRQEWLAQKDFFWQLAWRAPGIKPGTTLMTSEIPFRYYSDNSLTAPLNWIYAPGNSSTEMFYLLYDIEARLATSNVGLSSDQMIEMPYRTAHFEGSTSRAIVLFYDPPRCLKVMNPEIDRYLPVKPLYIRETAPFSKLELIILTPKNFAAPPGEIFGPEPNHAWCYYFEKAELYAQSSEWSQVVEMAEKALKITRHFTEKNVSELIPFILGYAHTEKWEKAVELTHQAFQIWDKTQYPLCDAWQSIRNGTPDSQEKQIALQDIQETLNCEFR